MQQNSTVWSLVKRMQRRDNAVRFQALISYFERDLKKKNNNPDNNKQTTTATTKPNKIRNKPKKPPHKQRTMPKLDNRL